MENSLASPIEHVIDQNTDVIDYVYDQVGNRQSRTSSVTGIANQTFGYDANDRLTSDIYDNNGNTTLGHLEGNIVPVSDTYDFENHLAQRTGGTGSNVTLVYDGDGNKVRETANGQTITYLIDNQNPTGYAQVVEELVNGSVYRRYTFGHDLISENQLIASVWSPSFYGYDGHGSVRLLTNSAGLVTDTYTYDAFGQLISSTGSTPNDYRYSGEQLDSNLGLYYLRARYLSAANGRFWSMDDYEGKGSEPASLHKYLYARGQPITNADPTGHDVTLSQVAVTSAIGAGLGGFAAGVAEYAHGRPVTVASVARGALIGSILGPGVLVPATAVGLGVGGIIYSTLDFGPILLDPGVSRGQKIAAAALIVASVLGADSAFRFAETARPVDPMGQIIENGAPVGNRFESILEDGSKVLFRKDFGEDAHAIGTRYPDPVDHYNIELHTPRPNQPGRFDIRLNIHVIVDSQGRVVDIITVEY